MLGLGSTKKQQESLTSAERVSVWWYFLIPKITSVTGDYMAKFEDPFESDVEFNNVDELESEQVQEPEAQVEEPAVEELKTLLRCTKKLKGLLVNKLKKLAK